MWKSLYAFQIHSGGERVETAQVSNKVDKLEQREVIWALAGYRLLYDPHTESPERITQLGATATGKEVGGSLVQ